MAETSHAENRLKNPDVRYEERDVSVSAILWFAGGLIVAAVVIHIALALLFAFFAKDEVGKRGPPAPLAAERSKLPAGPVLEEVQRLERGRQSGESRTQQDPQAGIVRIPVEEAMKIQVERLPVREGARERAQQGRREIPTDAGSGRFVPRREQP